MRTKRNILILCLGLFGIDLFGHDVPVHIEITANAAASAFDNSRPYHDFINVISSDFPLERATTFVKLGSAREDDDASQDPVGGNRSYNHFYDPITGVGLSDIPPDDRATVGTNSFTWASVSNCPALNFHTKLLHIVPVVLGDNINKSNVWSWQNARGYEWIGLTSATQLDRQTNFAKMFRSIGQVMHLLEDTSQPQHVRNEQHLYPFTNWFVNHFDPWISPIEKYGAEHLKQLNYSHSLLPWRDNGFTKLEDFWDRGKYITQGAQALVSDASTANRSIARLGLAEFANGNFLGARHLFPEYFKPGDIEYYPYPSRNTSTDYNHVRANPASGIHDLTLENGHQGQGIYLHKNADGVDVPHLSRVNYLGTKINGLIGVPYCTIADSNVLHDYHNILIPKAVEYSAGLLDYFFRGTFSVSVVYDPNSQHYTNTILNTSGQEFSGGSFFLYQEETNGLRTLIQPPLALSGSLSNLCTTNIVISGPVAQTTKYILVYKGTIGTSGGSPSDPADAEICIAARAFNLEPGSGCTDCGCDVNVSSLPFTWGSKSGSQGTVTTYGSSGTVKVAGGEVTRTVKVTNPTDCDMTPIIEGTCAWSLSSAGVNIYMNGEHIFATILDTAGGGGFRRQLSLQAHSVATITLKFSAPDAQLDCDFWFH